MCELRHRLYGRGGLRNTPTFGLAGDIGKLGGTRDVATCARQSLAGGQGGFQGRALERESLGTRRLAVSERVPFRGALARSLSVDCKCDHAYRRDCDAAVSEPESCLTSVVASGISPACVCSYRAHHRVEIGFCWAPLCLCCI